MKNLIIILLTFIVVSCSNPESELELEIKASIEDGNFDKVLNLSNQLLELNPDNSTAIASLELANREIEIFELSEVLQFQTANKDYFNIISTSKKLLELDNNNIQAINSFREAARIYEILKEAAELILKLETDLYSTEYNGDIDFNSEPELIKYAQAYYNTHFLGGGESAIDVDGKMGPSTKKAIKVLNNKIAGDSEDEATDVPNEDLSDAFELIELYKQLNDSADLVKESVSILEDIKKLYDKAERIDPRFQGVIELERFLEKRANFLTFKIVYGWYESYSTTIVNTHLTLFDSFYSLTNTYWDTYSQLNSYSSSYYSSSYSTSDAYQSARADVVRVLGHHQFEIIHPTFIQINNKYKNMMEDLDDEFDIDVLDPAIELSEKIVRITQLAYNAEGSLNGWYSAMEDTVMEYRDSYSEIVDEFEYDKVLESVIEENTSIREYYLDQDILDSYNYVKSLTI